MRKAACLFINPLTAFSFIDIMKKNNFKAAIHTAGMSAVGKMFTRLCVKNNFKVINTVRRENYLSEMKELGSSFTISTSNDSYKKELLLAKEEFKPEVAFDSIGGEMTGLILNALNDDGVLYHYGNLSSRNISNVLTYDILFANKSIQGFWLINYLKKANVNNSIIESFTETLKNDASLYDSNIQAVYKPENFEEAFKTYKENMTKGKILFDFTN
jgi:NADPH:quinone reductase-like Zn-dependent oxidoreductase